MIQPTNNWFQNRTLLIATRHKKEQLIAPLLESALGVRCVVPVDFDTDQFGTFSGEIPRATDPLKVLRQKCDAARTLYNIDLVLASEGSFGAHPSVGFLTCNEELILLSDAKHKLEIVERELSLETNMNILTTTDESVLLDFAQKCGFPKHGIILKSTVPGQWTKGITDEELLRATFRHYKLDGEVTIETDMRALYNPTRMNVIRKAAEKLVQRVLTNCPVCQTPGFGPVKSIPGKPCAQCHLPTNTIRATLLGCSYCDYKEEHIKPGEPFEDPTYCPFCNP